MILCRSSTTWSMLSNGVVYFNLHAKNITTAVWKEYGGKNGAGDSGSYFKSRRDMLMAYTRVGAAG